MRQALRENRGLRLGRSIFDLSYSKTMTGEFGYIYPIMVDDCIPNDIFRISARLFIRLMPQVSPVMAEINCFMHYFFVPYRILWDEWEQFITGWDPATSAEPSPLPTHPTFNPGAAGAGSLADYLGHPIGVAPHADFIMSAFPQYAYNLIYNEYYRDQNLINEISLTATSLRKSCWEKDYFTSALPWAQRQTAPAISLGSTSAVWTNATIANSAPTTPVDLEAEGNAAADDKIHVNDATAALNALNAFNDNTVDMSTGDFDVADLRTAVQIQRWMERNARAGGRYVEFLRARGAFIGDARLQRPEYIGGCRVPIQISEVLQTNEGASGTPVGNMAGHGIGAGMNRIGSYRVNEYGLIMGMLIVRPRTVYTEGIDRQWIKRTRYDYVHPEFVNLGEQRVEKGEIYVSGTASDAVTFGYQGRYNEHRYKQNMVAGKMRPGESYDHWHIGRVFGASPTLNSSFVECTPRKDFLEDAAEPVFMAQVGNIIKAARPIPVMPNPGMLDHI